MALSQSHEWVLLLYPNGEDFANEVEGGALVSMFHSNNGTDMQELVDTGRWVDVPQWLAPFCELHEQILWQEKFFLADAVNVSIRQLYVEHIRDEQEPAEESLRDEFFVHMLTQHVNGWNAKFEIHDGFRRGHDCEILNADDRVLCFEDLKQYRMLCRYLEPRTSLQDDLKKTLPIVHRILWRRSKDIS